MKVIYLIFHYHAQMPVKKAEQVTCSLPSNAAEVLTQLTFVLDGGVGHAVAVRRRAGRLRHVAADAAAVVEDANRPRRRTSRRQGWAAHHPRGDIVFARSASRVGCENKQTDPTFKDGIPRTKNTK